MDMFADPMAELLARIEALEAAVFAKAQKPAKESVDEPLNAAWQKWSRYRGGKKGWTAEARSLSMRTLRKLAGTDGALALAIVDQSIEPGWTALYPLKSQEASLLRSLTPVQHKTVKQALAPTEDRLTAHLTWLERQRDLGQISPDEFNAEAEKARERMG